MDSTGRFCGKIAGIEGPSDGKADISFAKVSEPRSAAPCSLGHLSPWISCSCRLENSSQANERQQESAAKTALLLSGGNLEGATIEVTSDDVEPPKVAQQAHAPSPAAATSAEHEPLNQEGEQVAEILRTETLSNERRR